MRNIILVIALAAVVYFAGNASVGLWDRDEPRYAQCSRQMLQSGDWVVPRLYDEIRANKPPLIYWCQATAMRLLGDAPINGTFAARLPSATAMLLTLAILAIAISRHVGKEQAFWTVLVMSSSLMTIVAAKVALTDSVLLVFGTIAQLCLYTIWRGSRSWKPAMLLAIALGLGAMTKPLVLLTVGATGFVLLVFKAIKEIRKQTTPRGFAVVGVEDTGSPGALPDIAPSRSISISVAQVLVGIFIIAIIVAPWLYLVHHRAPEFLGKATAEAKAHLESGKEGHRFPPGYHLLLIWVTFFPWCLLLPMAIGMGIRYRATPQIRFALAAAIGPWLVLEFFGTKLPHYILAAFPALSYLAASAIIRSLRGEDRDMESRPFLIGAGCWAFFAALVGLLPWLLVPGFRLPGIHAPSFPGQPTAIIATFTLATIAFGGAVFLFLKMYRLTAAMLTLGGGMMAICLIVYVLYLPRAQFLRVSIHVAQVLQRVGATHEGDAVMIDYKEPSLGFYQGGTIREEKRSFLLPLHWNRWPRWMTVTREALDGAPPESRARLRIVADPENPSRGLAYSDGGRVVELIVVERVAGGK
ncbi:MAG TPA: glycosyltransferase family 39 protein [Humisphaera sp.]|nr:glycosyltransferase family 39 protein [Humisphaera sp.]